MWRPHQHWLGQNWSEAKTAKWAVLRGWIAFYFVRGTKIATFITRL